jgi:hypothetical protein
MAETAYLLTQPKSSSECTGGHALAVEGEHSIEF